MKIKKNHILTFFIGAVVIIFSTFLHFSNSLKWLENKSYDNRVKHTAKYFLPAQDIAVVLVDQNSLDWAKEELNWSYPWPRSSYGKMIDFFNRGNAASVAFDIVYSEPSIYGEEDDISFAEANKRFGKSIQTVFYERNNSDKGTFPIDIIKDSAAKIATVQSLWDKDGIVRRARFYSSSSTKEPSLTVASLELSNEMPDINSIPKGKKARDSESEEGMYVRFMESLDDYIPYSAETILLSEMAIEEAERNGVPYDPGEDLLEPEMFEGMHVFIGLFAPGLFDICSTPIDANYPGVGVHIAMMDTILQEEYLYDVSDSVVVIIISISVILGIFLAAFYSQKQKLLSVKIIIFLILIIAYIFTSYPLFYKGIIIPVVSPIFAFIIAFSLIIIENYITEGQQRRFLKNAFSQCLDPDVVNQLCEHPETFKLGGEKVNMSAIFTDIQRFSSFSELLTAKQLVALLNFYLTEMSDIIKGEGGTVDKYEGDAIVAFVGAPVKMQNHAIRACSAAIKMKKAELILNKQIINYASEEKQESMDDELYEAFKIMVKNKKTIFTRIGINSGEMIAGFMGSSGKKNYTIMGNNVNLASRLEGVNKQYSTAGILISEHTKKDLNDAFVVRSLDRVQVMNIKTPLRLYELIEVKSEAKEELLKYVEDWEIFIKNFEEKNYEKALKIVKELSQRNIEQYPEDKVAKYYIKLLERFFTKGTYPTADDDVGITFDTENGVFTLLQK